MKSIIVVTIVALWVSVFLSCNNATGPDSSLFTASDIDTTLHIRVIQEGSLTIFRVDRYTTTIIKIPSISAFLYSQRPVKSLQQIGVDNDYALVVNSSFIDALYEDPVSRSGLHYRQAGYLKIRDTVYEGIKDDRQLSRLFAYDSRKNIVDYFGLNELDRTKDYDLVVQTGPQIIWQNEIDTASINSSLNGNRRAARTVFASVDGKEFYIIVSFDMVTLGDLGKMLRSTGIFKKTLNVIDFDGGPSTRIYIRNHPELGYFSEYPWPVLICVK